MINNEKPKARITIVITTLVIFSSMLIGCINSSPERDFADVDLLINEPDMPEGWREAEYTDNYPYDTEGAENLAYRTFSFEPTTYLVKAGHDVYRYQNPFYAGRGYTAYENRYMGQRPSDLSPWETPSEFNLTDSVAHQWRFACKYSSFAPAPEFGNKSRICMFLGQYEEFVIEFSATTEVDGTTFITIEEVSNIVTIIDQKMADKLDQ